MVDESGDVVDGWWVDDEGKKVAAKRVGISSL